MRLLAIALLLATACTSTTPTTQAPQPAPAPAETRPLTPGAVVIPPRGVSCNSAVVIDAATEGEGTAKERAWIAENYPGAREVGQALTKCNDKAADQVEIETANGQKRTIFFDISQWFGKH